MSKTKIGSAGGKATAIIEKEQARKRIDEQNRSPNLCQYCGEPILATYNKKLKETKRKKFCSQSCAAKFNNPSRNKRRRGVEETNYSHKLKDISDDILKTVYDESNTLSEEMFFHTYI